MSLPQNVEQSKTNHMHHPTRVESDTVCGAITGEGRSAVAVVTVLGSDANEIVSKCFEPATQGSFSSGEIRFGLWTGPHDRASEGESVVVTPMGRDRVEIHCHGGPAAISRILDDLQSAGAIRFADRWALESDEELMVREAMEVLSRCLTVKTAAIALDQVRGGLRIWARGWLERIEDDSADIESLRDSASRITNSAEFTSRLAEPFQVVLWGPPNVGKSSLLNAIVGFDRSITLDSAGTTRDVLHAETVIDGLRIRLSDTAGIRQSDESIEQQGISRARSTASEADLLVCVTEPALAGKPDPPILESEIRIPTISVLNKVDLVPFDSSNDSFDVATCALSGRGIDELMLQIARRLQSAMPARGERAAINHRQAHLVETIAEASSRAILVRQLRQLLYGCDETSQPPSA